MEKTIGGKALDWDQAKKMEAIRRFLGIKKKKEYGDEYGERMELDRRKKLLWEQGKEAAMRAIAERKAR